MAIIKKFKSVGVIGRGKWGQKIIKILRYCSSVKYIIGRNTDYKKCSTDIDWVFILTPNKTHYKICKFFLKKGVNVFCEKPLSPNLRQANNLYNLAKKNKVLLYVDDIEIFKNKKIKFFKNNYVRREKKDKGTIYSLIERLFYHDAYLIYNQIKKTKVKIKINSQKNLDFKINFNKKVVNFFYSIKSPNKVHKINNINLLFFKGDPLKKMIIYVLYKLNNYSKNKKRSLFAIKICSLLKKNIIK